jgi:hypothetical protein
MSQLEVNKVIPQSGTTLTLGESGDTITIASGATFTPTLTAPIIDEINDNNGNEEIIFTTTASAVNELTIANAATGNAPEIAATGDDTDIDLKLTPKGAGNLVLDGIEFPNADGSANQVLQTNGSGVLSFGTISAGFTLGTKVTASGTDVTFTGIPSTARMIVIGTDGLSFTGAGNPDVQLQLGDSGGIETTGYKATAVYLSTNSGEASPGGAGYTDKFVIGYQPDQSSTLHHQIILTCQDTASNTWNFSNLASAYSAGYIQCGAGVKSLSDTLTQLKLSFSGGQSFDAGTINIMYI